MACCGAKPAPSRGAPERAPAAAARQHRGEGVAECLVVEGPAAAAAELHDSAWKRFQLPGDDESGRNVTLCLNLEHADGAVTRFFALLNSLGLLACLFLLMLFLCLASCQAPSRPPSRSRRRSAQSEILRRFFVLLPPSLVFFVLWGWCSAAVKVMICSHRRYKKIACVLQERRRHEKVSPVAGTAGSGRCLPCLDLLYMS